MSAYGSSPAVDRLAVWLGGQVSFGQVSAVLAEVGQIHLSASSVWRRVEQYGDKWVECERRATAAANVVPSRDVPQCGMARHDQPMGIGVDGWMVHLREEGWKEVKTGAVFEVHQREVTDKRTGDIVEQATADACSYVAHLGGPEAFGHKLWREMTERRVPDAYDKVWIGDGAPWLWNLCQDYAPEAEQVVDWYHALSHLHAAATLMYGEQGDRRQRWLNQQETLLYQGHARQIAAAIQPHADGFYGKRAEKLRAEATYFFNNQHRMRYLDYREDGWPIGSGTIEGGCKQFQTRLKGSGMRWSRPGAERMLTLRAEILSGRFHHTWAVLANSPVS